METSLIKTKIKEKLSDKELSGPVSGEDSDYNSNKVFIGKENLICTRRLLRVKIL